MTNITYEEKLVTEKRIEEVTKDIFKEKGRSNSTWTSPIYL